MKVLVPEGWTPETVVANLDAIVGTIAVAWEQLGWTRREPGAPALPEGGAQPSLGDLADEIAGVLDELA
ncbi:MAG: hypothetical protein VW547_13280 [Alphaproteobacteria bacterium]